MTMDHKPPSNQTTRAASRPFNRPFQRSHGALRLALALSVHGWFLLGSAPFSHAELLRWKFNPGEVLHYSMEQKTVTIAKGMDRESKSTRSQTIDMSWKVNSVADGGQAEIAQRVDRVRMRAEEPGFMPFVFDSNNPKDDVPEPFLPVAQQLRALSGTEFTFRIRPTGEIEDIRFSQQTLKTLRDAASRGGPEGEFSEQGLKDLLLQNSPPAFPEGQVEPGKAWSSKQSRVPSGIGTIVMDRSFRFQGPDPKRPKLLVIGMETKVALEPAGGGINAEIRKQEGTGTMTFDSESGHLVATRVNQKIDMALTVTGQKLDQNTETITSMTLAP
jgi:hypothetical protein